MGGLVQRGVFVEEAGLLGTVLAVGMGAELTKQHLFVGLKFVEAGLTVLQLHSLRLVWLPNEENWVRVHVLVLFLIYNEILALQEQCLNMIVLLLSEFVGLLLFLLLIVILSERHLEVLIVA